MLKYLLIILGVCASLVSDAQTFGSNERVLTVTPTGAKTYDANENIVGLNLNSPSVQMLVGTSNGQGFSLVQNGVVRVALNSTGTSFTGGLNWNSPTVDNSSSNVLVIGGSNGIGYRALGAGAFTTPTLNQVLTAGNNAVGLGITNLSDGKNPQDAITKKQLDSLADKKPLRDSTFLFGGNNGINYLVGLKSSGMLSGLNQFPFMSQNVSIALNGSSSTNNSRMVLESNRFQVIRIGTNSTGLVTDFRTVFGNAAVSGDLNIDQVYNETGGFSNKFSMSSTVTDGNASKIEFTKNWNGNRYKRFGIFYHTIGSAITNQNGDIGSIICQTDSNANKGILLYQRYPNTSATIDGARAVAFDEDVVNKTGINPISGTYNLSGILNATTGVITVADPSGSSNPINLQYADANYSKKNTIEVFNTNGTYNKPLGAKSIRIVLIGGGGSGPSGANTATGIVSRGGGGGGGGGVVDYTIDAAQVPVSVSITIGAGAVGGTGLSVNNATGNVGAVGGTTSFGSLLRAVGGGAGSTTAGGAGGSSFPSSLGGGAGGISTAAGNGSATGTSTTFPPAGGASGGGISTANASVGGGVGGAVGIAGFSGLATIIAGGTAGTGAIGGNGNPASVLHNGGSGGGGGGASVNGNGFAGGNGGFPGGGGGGGGPCRNGFTSGAGGNGAGGQAIIYTYF